MGFGVLDYNGHSASDAGDLHLGKSAAVAFGLMVALAALEFKGDLLFGTKLVEHLGGYRGSLNQGSSYRGL